MILTLSDLLEYAELMKVVEAQGLLCEEEEKEFVKKYLDLDNSRENLALNQAVYFCYNCNGKIL